MISPKQISKVWASAKEINLPEEELRALVYSHTNKESIKSLTKEEAHEVIEKLVSLGARKGKAKHYKKTPSSKRKVIAKMTPPQASKIVAQMHDLGWDDQTLNDFSKKICKRPVKSLTKELASNLIEALKGLQESRQKEKLKNGIL